MAPKVIGATGAPAIPFERITEITLCAEVLCEVIGHYRMYSLEESRHAPAGVRKAAWDARIITTSKMEVKMSTEEIVRPCADLAVAHPLNEFIKASNEVGKGVSSNDLVRRNAYGANQDKQSAIVETNAKNVEKTASPNTAIDPGLKDSENDNHSNTGSKAAETTESIGDEKSTSTSKPHRGVVAPGDFMRQVRKLQEQKRSAPKAIPTGPPRRIVFGNLPEWADVSSVLQLVHGGTVERAWAENGDIIVQFVDREKCIEYYEAHSNGIKIKDDEDDVIISVAMPEDGLPDNAELWMRVEEGASRVVCLSGLPTGLKGTNDESILGIVSDPTWDGKKFDHIVIKPMEDGVDIYIFFYDLHDGWDFLQSVKEGTYDCVAKFEVDPCSAASGFHFVDEPNLMFTAICNAD